MFPSRQFDLLWATLWPIPSRVPSTRQQTHAQGHVSRKEALCTLPWCDLPRVQEPQSNLSCSFSTFFSHFMFADCLKSANDKKT